MPKSRLGKTDATFETAIKATYEIHNEHDDYRQLESAHVLAGAATVEHGVVARTFTAMGLERESVIEACRTELAT